MVGLFIFLVVLLLSLIGWYVFVLARRFLSLFPFYTPSKKTKLILALTTFAMLILIIVLWATVFDGLAFVVVFGLYMLLVALAMEIIGFAVRIAYRKKTDGVPRWWSVLFRSSIIPVVVSLVVTGYGAYNMTHIYRTDYTVTSDKLERDYTVVFVSDTHYGTIQDEDILTRAIDDMKAAQPDVLILGGDIVDEGTPPNEIKRVFSELASVAPPLGVYYVWGNHDRSEYRQPAQFDESDVVAAIKAAGITLVCDDAIQLAPDLTLIGREDPGHFDDGTRASIDELLAGVNMQTFVLTADHQPKGVEENARAGVDLQLSGHTHAGQVWPGGALIEVFGGYVYGRYDVTDFTLIVSSGFTGWGFPVRTEEHCEYVVIHLTRQ